MIRYALVCGDDHGFEGWFSASDDFDEQAGRGLLSCPVCGSPSVRKQIMAPSIAAGAVSGSKHSGSGMRAMMMEAMGKVRAHVEENFDYVGDRFAVEARQIHEGRAEERGIYGEATPVEVKALVADGVPIAPLPPPPQRKSDLN
jgi:hypothetical protein